MTEIRQGGPNEFRRAIRAYYKDIQKWQVRFHKDVHISVLNGMVERCPVGNTDLWVEASLPAPPGYAGGRARGGFQSSVTTAPTGETGKVDPSGFPTKQDNVAAITSLKPWSKSWITNNVPYVVALNDRPNPNAPGKGWSTQAPLQWMEGEVELVHNLFGVGKRRI